ncbi:hypothetical protein F4861DRAFT_446603 [Xylaria intraflava]|nr:hypothetical protein F4861DRAFT_446603 [Xylaria intraflava]
MCTGIAYVYHCNRQHCGSVMYKLMEAAPGYTCPEARRNHRRGVCVNGIRWAYYDRVADEICLFCEVFGLGGEISGITAETCEEGTQWPEDNVDDNEDEDDQDGGASIHCEDDDADVEEGGARIH